MSHFAKVENGIVTNVIVAEQDFIDSLEDKENWIQTSYNTHGGIHYLPDSNIPSGRDPLRYNYAYIGCSYSEEFDAFIPINNMNGWILNTKSFTWEPPYPKPTEFSYWDNEMETWID